MSNSGGPRWRKCTVYRQTGPGGLPLALRLSERLGHACTFNGGRDEGGSSTQCATNGAAGCFNALQMPKNEAMRESYSGLPPHRCPEPRTPREYTRLMSSRGGTKKLHSG